jgi:uncharacterized protein (TIGR02145 family)
LYLTIKQSVTPSVSISSNAINNSINCGTLVTFTATPTNGGINPIYQWKLNGNNVVGANNATYTNNNLSDSDVVSVVMTVNNNSTVNIGNQSWMNKNLDVSTYNNGDVIPQITDSISWTNATYGAWCYYNNDSATYAAKYGKLYNWYAINDSRGLAPAGFHVPSLEEWQTMNTSLGGGLGAGNALKSTSDWLANNGTNASGFNAYPGGIRFLETSTVSSFFGNGNVAAWWTTNLYNDSLPLICGILDSFVLDGAPKSFGLSVRCIKNEYDATNDVLNCYTTTTASSNAIVTNVIYNHDTLVVSTCDAYTWTKNGQTYTSSGTYSFHADCDSSFLILSISTTTSNTTTASNCDSYTWSVNGQTYTATGTYTSVSGCNTEILNLTINQPSASIETISSNTPITWHGVIYSSSTNNATWTTTNSAGCDSTVTLHLTITCTPSSSVEIVSACSSYIWHGVTYTSSNNTATWRTLNAGGCDSVVTLNLTIVKLIPAAPAAMAQTLVSNLCGQRVYRYTVTAVTNASGYSWLLPSSVGGVSGVTLDSGDINNSRIIRIKYASNAAALTTDSIKVRAFSACGNSNYKGIKLTNLMLNKPAAPTVTVTSVQTNVCGARKYRYRASALPAASTTVGAATGWLWTLPEGSVGSTGTIDSGDVNSQTIVVAYTSNAAAAAGDTIRVRFTSDCGLGAVKATKLTNTALGVPAAPTVTVTPFASNVCGARKYRYTASALRAASSSVGAATGWLWTLADGAVGSTGTIDSGSVNSQVIVVSYSSNAAAVAGDSIRVRFTSDCGLGAVKATKLTNTVLGVPAAPTVTVTSIASNVCGARKYRYTASALPAASTTVGAATGWLWTLADGAVGSTGTIDSGSVSSQVIVVSYTSNAAAVAGDSIRVRFTSDCGLGAVKATKLTNTALNTPAAPLSITIALVSDKCGERVYRYTAPVLPAATTTAGAPSGYLWSMPIGTVGSTGVLDSADLTSRVIRIKYSSNAAASTGDTIKVMYTSACGNSPLKAQKLTNAATTILAAPTTLTGTTSICSIVGTSVGATYTCSAVSNAVSYVWTIPAGAVIDSGSNGLKIKVRFITASAADSIFVQAVGTTGCFGAKKVLKLITTGCVTPTYTRVENQTSINTPIDLMTVSVYPNPTTSSYHLFVKSNHTSTVIARVFDAQGRLVNTFRFNSSETIAFGNELKGGVYLVELRDGKQIKTVRVVKY